MKHDLLLLIVSTLVLWIHVAVAQTGNCTVTVADFACETAGFATLCDALQLTGLKDELSVDEWTVFAPLDGAFAELGEDNMEYFWNDTLALTELLLFHVLPSQSLFTSDMECEAGMNLLDMASDGQSRTMCLDEIPHYQKGTYNAPPPNAPVLVTKDVEMCNGLIQVIDKVMLDTPLPFAILSPDGETIAETPESVVTEPPTFEDSDESGPTDDAVHESGPTDDAVQPDITMSPIDDVAGRGEEGDCLTIVELACSLEDFTQLCAMVGAQPDIVEALDEGNWTVFAPIDNAFDQVLLPQEQDAIANILMFHVVPEKVLLLTDLQCSQLMDMANGEPSRTICEGDDLSLRRSTFQKGAGNPAEAKPEIVLADVTACNGVIHVVNQVMLP